MKLFKRNFLAKCTEASSEASIDQSGKIEIRGGPFDF